MDEVRRNLKARLVAVLTDIRDLGILDPFSVNDMLQIIGFSSDEDSDDEDDDDDNDGSEVEPSERLLTIIKLL